MLKMLRQQLHRRHTRQAFLFLLFAAIMMVNVVPELRADALNLLTDGRSASALDTMEPIGESRILRIGFGAEEPLYTPGQKAAIIRSGITQYATTREGEDLATLLRRAEVPVGALDIVRVEHTKDGVTLNIASDFSYYETETTVVPFGTVTETSYRVPKGETQLARAGQNGEHSVVYEVVYADGQFISRQAVQESDTAPVDELIYTGTLVKSTTRDDRIEKVITEEDGSGYLILTSGDSLHFTGTKKVTCTAYTANVGKVGTITATGTRVHEGVLAVDKRVIPLGTKMFVVGSSGYSYGYGVAEDTGVLGAWVDLYMDTYRKCMNFGLQKNSTVYLLDP